MSAVEDASVRNEMGRSGCVWLASQMLILVEAGCSLPSRFKHPNLSLAARYYALDIYV